MARRRTLEAPDAATLAEIEKGFAAKPGGAPLGLGAPIAKVASETAQSRDARSAEDRAAEARRATQAEAWSAAQAEGRVIETLPLDRIKLNHLSRDRIDSDPEEMAELVASIRASGQRLPVEVVPLEDGQYGLISGWRRLRALSMLAAEEGRPAEVRALVRPAIEAGAAYAAMVEENEIRAQLRPYERGRIAAVAAQTGTFESVEAAVDVIFAAASKAKRSKIRGFALVHFELGDLLNFPRDLSEANGGKLAVALRAGFAAKLRAALEHCSAEDAAAEWALLEPVVQAAQPSEQPSEQPSAKKSRGGRPRRAAAAPLAETVLADGAHVAVREERGKLVVTLDGQGTAPRAAAERMLALLSQHWVS